MLLLSLLALAAGQTADAPPSILEITVQRLPASFKQNPIVQLVFNDKGGVSSCKVTQTSGSPGIDRAACVQVQGNVKVTAEPNTKPEPRTATVTFVAETPRGG